MSKSKVPVQPKQEPMELSAVTIDRIGEENASTVVLLRLFKVQNMLLAAQQQIKARQEALNFQAPVSAQQRLAELKGRIASQMGSSTFETVSKRICL